MSRAGQSGARWIRHLTPDVDETADALGGKAHGLVVLKRLGLPVPPGFVIGTEAGRAFLRDGRLPDGLAAEVTTAVAGLEAETGRRFGGPDRPLALAVRSGAAVSMPGMMSTVLNVGLTAAATAGLAAETRDAAFAHDSRRRLLASLTEAGGTADDGVDDATEHLLRAITAVFSSWHTPRARTYRDLYGIPPDLGTAVVVQAMVFGNRDRRSGTGVAFSRDPRTGTPVPSGDVVFGAQGDDLVSGRSSTRPLADLAAREPGVWAGLRRALDRVERHYREACYLEFTFQSGELWLLQVRPERFAGAAAIRLAVDLADEGLIGRAEALLRVSCRQLGPAGVLRITVDGGTELLARGVGASPGVAVGRIAATARAATRMAASGPVILVRPQTSPLDLPGIAAAAGVLTAVGGATSHAAVVARAMGRPAVVGAAGLTVAGSTVRVGERTLDEGTLIAIDGTGGEVVLGRPRVTDTVPDPHRQRLLAWADEVSGDASVRSDAERLGDAHRALGHR